MKRWIIAAFALTSLTVLSSRSEAGPGIRGGITDDPDTIFVGFFYEIPLAPAGPGFFAVEPGIDVGFDDDFFTIRGTANGKFLVPVGAAAYVYPILGLSLYYVNVDNDYCGGHDCDETFTGINLGAGFAISRFNVELTAGIDDLPDLTLSVGFQF